MEPAGGEGSTPSNNLYGDALPEMGTFFRHQVHKRKRFNTLRYIKG